MRRASRSGLGSAWLLIGLLGCASADIPTRGGAADPGAAATPVPSGVGALRSDFDAERLAPGGSPDAGDPHAGHHHEAAPAAAPLGYTCPMHPEVVAPQPGSCPKCGMDLVPKVAPKSPADPHQGHR